LDLEDCISYIPQTVHQQLVLFYYHIYALDCSSTARLQLFFNSIIIQHRLPLTDCHCAVRVYLEILRPYAAEFAPFRKQSSPKHIIGGGAACCYTRIFQIFTKTRIPSSQMFVKHQYNYPNAPKYSDYNAFQGGKVPKRTKYPRDTALAPAIFTCRRRTSGDFR
jgi:hypothetical protein